MVTFFFSSLSLFVLFEALNLVVLFSPSSFNSCFPVLFRQKARPFSSSTSRSNQIVPYPRPAPFLNLCDSFHFFPISIYLLTCVRLCEHVQILKSKEGRVNCSSIGSIMAENPHRSDVRDTLRSDAIRSHSTTPSFLLARIEWISSRLMSTRKDVGVPNFEEHRVFLDSDTRYKWFVSRN